ncbi:hypothetical protein WDU94_015063 [Cyamophila willieti]
MLETMALGTPVKSLSTLDSSTVSHSDSQILKSPDLFESEESDDGECFTEDTTSSKPEDIGFKLDVDVRDEKYLKTLKTTLAGIPPPPKFTIPQFSAAEMLEMYNKNVEDYLGVLKDVDKTEDKVINEEMKQLQFPDSMKCLYYGIHYNRGPVSVEFESLSDKYRARYVGCETSSTVIDKAKTNSATDHLTGSAKKKARRHPWNYSPGRRLSHLARRRQIFTSASMAKSALGNRAVGRANGVMDSKRMILLDKKKSSQTSSTSACRARLSSLSLAASSRTSTSSGVYSTMPTLESNAPTIPTNASHSQMPSLKRALFQSPDCFSKDSSAACLSSADCKETPRTDKNKARRALFSSGTKKTPSKKTPNKKTPNKKTPRKGGGGLGRTPHKGTPTSSRKKTPRKSLFADPDSRNRLSSRDLFNVNGKRGRSESLLNLHQSAADSSVNNIVTLSNDEKKKLLWVVYHCLKEKKINTKNSLYKPCQNYLYRLCSDEWKAQLREHPVGGKVSNVSERMLNIARKFVSGVILKIKNQSFYHSSSSAKLDNSSESGDTSVSHSASNPADSRLQDHLSTCDEKSDLESVAAKSDFDRESICARSDIDRESICARSDIDRESICARSDIDRDSMCEKSEYSYRLTGGESSNSCLHDEDTNTTGSVGPNIDQLESLVAGRLENIGQSCTDSMSVRLGTIDQSNTGPVGDENMDQSDSLELSKLENIDQSNSTSSLSTSSLHCKRNSNTMESKSSFEETTSSVSLDTVSSSTSSVPLAQDVFSLTNASLLREVKSCKVELGVSYEKRALSDITSMYDEETRF